MWLRIAFPTTTAHWRRKKPMTKTESFLIERRETPHSAPSADTEPATLPQTVEARAPLKTVHSRKPVPCLKAIFDHEHDQRRERQFAEQQRLRRAQALYGLD